MIIVKKETKLSIYYLENRGGINESKIIVN
jgi:hypothetical protein